MLVPYLCPLGYPRFYFSLPGLKPGCGKTQHGRNKLRKELIRRTKVPEFVANVRKAWLCRAHAQDRVCEMRT